MSNITILDSLSGSILDTLILGIPSYQTSALYDSLVSQMEFRFPFDFREALANGEVIIEIN